MIRLGAVPDRIAFVTTFRRLVAVPQGVAFGAGPTKLGLFPKELFSEQLLQSLGLSRMSGSVRKGNDFESSFKRFGAVSETVSFGTAFRRPWAVPRQNTFGNIFTMIEAVPERIVVGMACRMLELFPKELRLDRLLNVSGRSKSNCLRHICFLDGDCSKRDLFGTMLGTFEVAVPR